MNKNNLLAFMVAVSIIGFTAFKTSIPMAEDEFSHGIVQIGVVVSDFDRAYDFYTNVLGMTQTGGFDIDEDFAKRSGLTGGKPFSVAVLQLKDSEKATQWKLMSFAKEGSGDKSKYIQDDTGIQYVTLYVTSLAPFIERFKKHDVKFLGETPTALDGDRHFALVQDPDGTFIELIGPMK